MQIRISDTGGLVCPAVKLGSRFGTPQLSPTEKVRDVQIWGCGSGLFFALIEIIAELNSERYKWFNRTEHSLGSGSTEAVGCYDTASNLLLVLPLLFGWPFCTQKMLPWRQNAIDKKML